MGLHLLPPPFAGHSEYRAFCLLFWDAFGASQSAGTSQASAAALLAAVLVVLPGPDSQHRAFQIPARRALTATTPPKFRSIFTGETCGVAADVVDPCCNLAAPDNNQLTRFPQGLSRREFHESAAAKTTATSSCTPQR